MGGSHPPKERRDENEEGLKALYEQQEARAKGLYYSQSEGLLFSMTAAGSGRGFGESSSAAELLSEYTAHIDRLKSWTRPRADDASRVFTYTTGNARVFYVYTYMFPGGTACLPRDQTTQELVESLMEEGKDETGDNRSG